MKSCIKNLLFWISRISEMLYEISSRLYCLPWTAAHATYQIWYKMIEWWDRQSSRIYCHRLTILSPCLCSDCNISMPMHFPKSCVRRATKTAWISFFNTFYNSFLLCLSASDMIKRSISSHKDEKLRYSENLIAYLWCATSEVIEDKTRLRIYLSQNTVKRLKLHFAVYQGL